MGILGKIWKIADITTGHTANILDAVTNQSLDIFEKDLKIEDANVELHKVLERLQEKTQLL